MISKVENRQDICLIIIVTYNGDRWIEACLHSFLDQEDSQILVIDNGSQDETSNILHSFSNRIILVENEMNIGFGQACNQGMKFAIQQGFDSVFLVNQDTLSSPNLVKGLRRTLSRFPNIGILSPMHFADSEHLDPYFERYISSDLATIYKEDSAMISLPFVNAAFWYLPFRTLKEVGGFDPLFFHYGEDNDYAKRVLKNGFDIAVDTSLVAYHLDRNTDNKIQSSNDYYRYLLLVLKDVNDKLWLTWMKFWYDFGTLAVRNLIQGKCKQNLYLWKAGFQLCCRYPAIYKSRNQNQDYLYLVESIG